MIRNRIWLWAALVLAVVVLSACARLLPAPCCASPVPAPDDASPAPTVSGVELGVTDVAMSLGEELEIPVTVSVSDASQSDRVDTSLDWSSSTCDGLDVSEVPAVFEAVESGACRIAVTSVVNPSASDAVSITVFSPTPVLAEEDTPSVGEGVDVATGIAAVVEETSEGRRFTFGSVSLLVPQVPVSSPSVYRSVAGVLEVMATARTLSVRVEGAASGSVVGLVVPGSTAMLSALADDQGRATVAWPVPDEVLDEVVLLKIRLVDVDGLERTLAFSTALPDSPIAPEVLSVTVSPNTIILQVGYTQQLTTVVTFTGSATDEVAWESSDAGVVSVNASGLLTAVSLGEASVEASSVTDPSKVGTVSVTVVNAFTLADNSVTITCDTALIGDTGVVNGVTYTKRTRAQLDALIADGDYALVAATCTSGIENMDDLFLDVTDFNEDIRSWDVSSVSSMNSMFNGATTFNQNLAVWCVDDIAEAPSLFSQDAAAWTENQPAWGVCPSTLFALADNDVTITCDAALIGDTGVVNGVTYTKRNRDGIDILVDAGDVQGGWDELPTTCISGITSMNELFFPGFETFSAFNEDISSWDTSGVTDMDFAFARLDTFNQSLAYWNTSSVTTMVDTFWRASEFNNGCASGVVDCPLTWDTSNVTNMAFMFQNAELFNQPIGDWDTSNVTDMKYMFSSIYAPPNSFDQPIGDWDTSNVTDMQGMFRGNITFNQDLGSWDTSKVTDMNRMFLSAELFNQPIGDWDTSSVTNMTAMFYEAIAFDRDLSLWCVTYFNGSEPGNFAAGATAWTEAKPDWAGGGTCN